MAVNERDREKGGRRDPAVHFARDPQETGDGQRRDGQHDQLHRRLEPDHRPERHDQQVDAEVADRRPVIVVILLERGRVAEVELDPIAAHVAEQVDQRRDRRIEQRDGRRRGSGRAQPARLPPRRAAAIARRPAFLTAASPPLRRARLPAVSRAFKPAYSFAALAPGFDREGTSMQKLLLGGAAGAVVASAAFAASRRRRLRRGSRRAPTGACRAADPDLHPSHADEDRDPRRGRRPRPRDVRQARHQQGRFVTREEADAAHQAMASEIRRSSPSASPIAHPTTAARCSTSSTPTRTA